MDTSFETIRNEMMVALLEGKELNENLRHFILTLDMTLGSNMRSMIDCMALRVSTYMKNEIYKENKINIDKDKVVCESCCGEGKILIDTCSGKFEEQYVECSACNGDGKVDK